MKRMFCIMLISAMLCMCVGCGNEHDEETETSVTSTETTTTATTTTSEETYATTSTSRATERTTEDADSGWGMCSSCHKRKATHGVYCDDCYYKEVEDLANKGISTEEVDMWANGYDWYDDAYYYD